MKAFIDGKLNIFDAGVLSQLTSSNTSLTNMIVELQTLVAKRLSSSDKAFEPLPYDTIRLTGGRQISPNTYDYQLITFEHFKSKATTVSFKYTWGVNNNFYPKVATIYITDQGSGGSDSPINERTDGVTIYANIVSSLGTETLFQKTYSYQNTRFIIVNSEFIFRDSIPLAKQAVRIRPDIFDDYIDIYVTNNTDTTIKVTVEIEGIVTLNDRSAAILPPTAIYDMYATLTNRGFGDGDFTDWTIGRTDGGSGLPTIITTNPTPYADITTLKYGDDSTYACKLTVTESNGEYDGWVKHNIIHYSSTCHLDQIGFYLWATNGGFPSNNSLIKMEATYQDGTIEVVLSELLHSNGGSWTWVYVNSSSFTLDQYISKIRIYTELDSADLGTTNAKVYIDAVNILISSSKC